MVKVGVYFFGPQGRNKYNNSELVLDFKYNINKCTDIDFIELSPIWREALPIVKRSYPNYNVILAVGETDLLHTVGEIEYEAVEKGFTEKNKNTFPRLNNIRQNLVHDPLNNYTCNSLNFYLIPRVDLFAFVHVPVNVSNNINITDDLFKLMDSLVVKSRVHYIQAKIELKFHRGYTGLKNPPCRTGIYFPFNNLEEHEMTMENTPINLDLIFISKGQKILAMKQGKKYSGAVSHRGYSVLEVRTPYCKENHVQVGDIVSILPIQNLSRGVNKKKRKHLERKQSKKKNTLSRKRK
jgi:uncharacterized membrane protein (UPF0127 family)